MNSVDIRSSSIAIFMDCSEMWAAIHLEKRYIPGSVPAWMGTSIHHGAAHFDTERVEGRQAIIKDAVEAAVDKFDNPTEEIRWTADDYSKSDAKMITILATEKYCTDLSPQFTFGAVELRPEPLEIAIDGLIVRLTGQMDRTRLIKGRPGEQGISDLKTGKRAIRNGQAYTQGFKFQIGVYEMLLANTTQQPVTLPGVIAGISTVKKPQAALGYIHNASQLLIGTQEQPGILERMAGIIKSGQFLPNPRSMLCSGKYCPVYHTCKAHD